MSILLPQLRSWSVKANHHARQMGTGTLVVGSTSITTLHSNAQTGHAFPVLAQGDDRDMAWSRRPTPPTTNILPHPRTEKIRIQRLSQGCACSPPHSGSFACPSPLGPLPHIRPISPAIPNGYGFHPQRAYSWFPLGSSSKSSKNPDQGSSSPTSTTITTNEPVILQTRLRPKRLPQSFDGPTAVDPHPPVETPVSTTSRVRGNRLVLRSGAFGIPKPRNSDHSHHSSAGSTKTITSTSTSSSTHHSFTNVEGRAETRTRAVQVGEDAYFYGRCAMGISDGVGGWNVRKPRPRLSWLGGITRDPHERDPDEDDNDIKEKPDPGRFSRLLMHFCEVEAEAWERERLRMAAKVAAQKGLRLPPGTPVIHEQDTEELDDVTEKHDADGVQPSRHKIPLMDPVEIMQKAYERCIASTLNEGVLGSATCMLAVLDGNKLRIANLGDCAILMIRKGEIVFRTEEMQHGVSCDASHAVTMIAVLICKSPPM